MQKLWVGLLLVAACSAEKAKPFMCPEGSHEEPIGSQSCVTTLAPWTAGPSLEQARDHHMTFIATTPAGTFLYAMAGMGDDMVLSSIERAPVAADGTLGAFDTIGDLPEGLIGAGFAQVGNSFVVAGGLDTTNNSTTSAYVGRVADDGTITATAGPSLAVSRYHVAVAYAKGFVFAIGGLNQDVTGTKPKQTVEATIERATFDGTTLGAWQTIDPLPKPLTHTALVASGGALYLIGGGSTVPASASILRATVADDGTLSAWTEIGTLPEGRATASALVHLDHLYVFAGMAQLTGEERDTVLRAPLDPTTGVVGAFEMLAPLPEARAHCHQTPHFADHLYSVGGSISHVGQAEVYVTTLK